MRRFLSLRRCRHAGFPLEKVRRTAGTASADHLSRFSQTSYRSPGAFPGTLPLAKQSAVLQEGAVGLKSCICLGRLHSSTIALLFLTREVFEQSGHLKNLECFPPDRPPRMSPGGAGGAPLGVCMDPEEYRKIHKVGFGRRSNRALRRVQESGVPAFFRTPKSPSKIFPRHSLPETSFTEPSKSCVSNAVLAALRPTEVFISTFCERGWP